MEECTLTSAYVVIDETGRIQSWNCSAGYENGVLRIVPDEDLINAIHLNSFRRIEVETSLAGKRIRKSCLPGMRWVRDEL